MDKTKSTIKEIIGKAGHKDTTVHETINPSVKRETVKPTQHENVHTAVDREVHEDHYHHTVQPVKDREVLPEQHHHKVAPVQHQEFEHRNRDGVKNALAHENQKFRDERHVQETTHTQSHAPTAAGDHVHHHVHETIQPVIEKEVVQPHVVHTTVPVHEVHHNAAHHHSTSALPPVSLEEYKRTGGALNGREERFDAFDGEPRDIGSEHFMQRNRDPAYDEKHPPKGVFHGDDGPTNGISNHTAHGRDHSDRETRVPGAGGNTATSHGAHNSEFRREQANGSELRRDHPHNSQTSPPRKEPGLLNKLNPKTDSNGDGKAGFMK
ncbi:hypothetical protein SLS62_000773 [Diatrype stigma]|uniref:Allergen n=1 Tax=Diatrype stigma TaxID=117547 RepID=A0AAN9UX64_9PEZI